MFQVLGKECVDFLIAEIIAESKKAIPGKIKLENVVNAFKDKYIDIAITDRMINLAIEFLVAKLKKDKEIS